MRSAGPQHRDRYVILRSAHKRPHAHWSESIGMVLTGASYVLGFAHSDSLRYVRHADIMNTLLPLRFGAIRETDSGEKSGRVF